MLIMRKLHWALHNIVGHPLMGILQLIGFNRAGNWAHDVTLPKIDDLTKRALALPEEDRLWVAQKLIKSLEEEPNDSMG